jgi:membrane fusion protein, heavy metal efflux system
MFIINNIITKRTNRLMQMGLFTLAIFVYSCHNHKEGDGHNHGTESTTSKSDTTKATEEHHDEGAPTIAALTDAQMNSVGITLGDIEMKQLTATVELNGALSVPNDNKANITSLFGGVVKQLNIQNGTHVRKGQIIATVANNDVLKLQQDYLELLHSGGSDNSSATYNNSQYASLNLEKQTLQPQIEYAQKEYNRQKELFEGNAGARKNLELAQSNLKSLQEKSKVLNEQLAIFKRTSNNVSNARLSGIKTQLQNMGINPNTISASNLRNTFYVTSPIEGNVSNVFAKIGSYIDVSSPVAEVVNNNSLHLDLNVFEKDLPKLRIGQTIHFTLTNNPYEEYDAQVYSIGSAFENSSKTIPVHCKVLGNKKGLIDGMNITALVSLDNITAATVPNDAIVEADGKFYIFVKTDKAAEEHHEEEEEEGHSHGAGEKHSDDEAKHKVEKTTNFEKIEVVKGVSELGHTAITPVTEIPAGTKVAVKGAFFINAKLSNKGEGHSH